MFSIRISAIREISCLFYHYYRLRHCPPARELWMPNITRHFFKETPMPSVMFFY